MRRRLAIRPMTTSRSRSRASWVSRSGVPAELLLGEQPGLDAAGELDLLGGGEQRDPADLAQVLAEQVGGRAAGVRPARGAAAGGSAGSGAPPAPPAPARRAGSRVRLRVACGAALRRDRARTSVSASAPCRPTLSVWVRVWVCTGATSRMIAAEACGSGTSGAESTASPLSVPYAMSGTAGVCGPAAGRIGRAPRTQAPAPSVEYDTSPPRGACGDFLSPVRDRVVTAVPRSRGRGPRLRSSERGGAALAQRLGVLLEHPQLVLHGGQVGRVAAGCRGGRGCPGRRRCGGRRRAGGP